MKKFFLAVAALAMLATSCTKDETTVAGGESLVSFSIDSPELATRYGEGTTATNLEWAFYDETGAQLTEISGSISNFSGKHTINVALVDGRQYTALFWASAPAAPYTVDWANKKMSVATTGLTANNEAYDAFYKYTAVDQTKKVHKIELTRPFAQINIATAQVDFDNAANAGLDAAQTKVTVNAYKTLDLVNGDVKNPASFEFGWAAKAEGVAKTNYPMLAMNYVLVNTRELVNVTMEVRKDASETPITRTYSTVPVQRNYQTFILGNLLTTQNDFNVEVEEDFNQTILPETEAEKLALTLQVGGEYTLTEDVVLKAPLTIENNVVATINLNGKTISYTNPDEDAYTAVFMVKKGILTIEGEGNVVANGVGNIAVWAGRGDAANDGKVIIKGGNFSNNSSQELIYTNNKGVIEIYGGTFSVAEEDKTSFADPQFAVLNLYGNGKTGNDIIVYGGTFHKFNPADNISENPKKNFCAEGYKVVKDGDVYTVVAGHIGHEVADAAALTAALADSAIETISLAEGVVYEGTFTVNRTVTINSKNADNKGTIKGRVNISGDATFKNINFEINDASKAKNTFKDAAYQYPAIATIYAAAATFEDCDFDVDIATGVCGINYGAHVAGKPLTVNKCTFEGDFYAIRSRTLFSITNCDFNIYTDQGKLAAVFTWGNGTSGTNNDAGANSVVFTGNTNSNANEVYGVQLTSTTFNYAHINYNVQGNTGFAALADGVRPTCNFANKTFAEGSETF